MYKKIVILKHTKDGPVYQPDEIIGTEEAQNAGILHTAINGTIVMKGKKALFGPNCPNGVAVFEEYNSRDCDGTSFY